MTSTWGCPFCRRLGPAVRTKAGASRRGWKIRNRAAIFRACKPLCYRPLRIPPYFPSVARWRCVFGGYHECNYCRFEARALGERFCSNRPCFTKRCSVAQGKLHAYACWMTRCILYYLFREGRHGYAALYIPSPST